MPFCELSSGVMFAIGFTGFMTLLGALIGLVLGKNHGYNSQVAYVFAGSAAFFMISVMLAPYVSTMFPCTCSVIG
jgi:uncharacterized membrane protein YuzA (DUF378 family)